MAEIIKKLGDINLTYVYLGVLILVVVPLIVPVGLPIYMDPKAVEFFDTIENLPPGSKILFNPEFSPGTAATYESVAIRFIEQCFQKGHKVYIYSTVQMAPIVKDWLVNEAPSVSTKEYGVDWIHFGFVPGSPDIAKATFAEDVRSAFPTDYEQKKSLDEYPMMEGVNTISDFDLLFDIYTGLQTLDSNLRQWVLPIYPDLKWVQSPNQVDAMTSLTWYGSGHMTAIIFGPTQYAVYERLTKLPGDQLKSLDVLSLTEIYAVILVIIGNANYLIQRRSEN
jgi:hypothetical protein